MDYGPWPFRQPRRWKVRAYDDSRLVAVRHAGSEDEAKAIKALLLREHPSAEVRIERDMR